MSTSPSLAEAEARLAAAVGAAAWGTALGTGSFLTVEFGDPVESAVAGGRVHGRFHLWIYLSAWRIESAAVVRASSEDPRDRLAEAVRVLDGKTLTAIAVDPVSLSATFSFTQDTLLRTFSVYTADADHWMFYLPEGDVFTAGPGTAWSWGR